MIRRIVTSLPTNIVLAFVALLIAVGIVNQAGQGAVVIFGTVTEALRWVWSSIA